MNLRGKRFSFRVGLILGVLWAVSYFYLNFHKITHPPRMEPLYQINCEGALSWWHCNNPTVTAWPEEIQRKIISDHQKATIKHAKEIGINLIIAPILIIAFCCFVFQPIIFWLTSGLRDDIKDIKNK